MLSRTTFSVPVGRLLAITSSPASSGAPIVCPPTSPSPCVATAAQFGTGRLDTGCRRLTRHGSGPLPETVRLMRDGAAHLGAERATDDPAGSHVVAPVRSEERV